MHLFLRWKHLGSSTSKLEIGDIKSMILAAFPVNATEHEAEDLHGHKVRWCCQLLWSNMNFDTLNVCFLPYDTLLKHDVVSVL